MHVICGPGDCVRYPADPIRKPNQEARSYVIEFETWFLMLVKLCPL